MFSGFDPEALRGRQLGTIAEAKALSQTKDIWLIDYSASCYDEGWDCIATCYLVESLPDGTQDVNPITLSTVFDHVNHRPMGLEDEIDTTIKAIVSACNEPGNLAPGFSTPSFLSTVKSPFTPSRPSKVLVQSMGISKYLKNTLKSQLNISVGIADESLMQKSKSKRINDSSVFTQKYVSETVNLGAWKPKGEYIANGVPKEWYTQQPPTDGREFKTSLLWGWRSNLELAAKSNDQEKLLAVIKAHDSHEVAAFCNMRNLLQKAAKEGLSDVCKILVQHGGALVDGVKSKDNKPEYKALQKSSGNNGSARGNTPLLDASDQGRTVIVNFLLSNGANPNICNANKFYPLHRAAARGHIDIVIALINGGADTQITDFNGTQAIEIAREYQSCYPENNAYNKIIDILENPGSVYMCGFCRKGPCKLKCPCGRVRYCNPECQAAHWKAHKADHKVAMTA